jgi:hypothetical protein
MRERRKPSWIVWGSIAFMLMLIAYPLSIGPAVYLLDSRPGHLAADLIGIEGVERIFHVVYAPLEFLVTHCPEYLQNGVETYVDWWGKLAAQ